MRFLLLGFALAIGCSSSDSTTSNGPVGVNACTQSGGLCAVNIPFTCTGGNTVAATDSTLATACGKSEGDIVRDIECCIPVTHPADTGTDDTGESDTGTGDGGGDSSTDGGSETSTDGATDGSGASDASEAG
ncbi:MAG: hypothetical protein ACXVEF_02240 [Polyangiales bacterium]